MKVLLVAALCVIAMATTDAFMLPFSHFGGFPGHQGFVGGFHGMFPHGLGFPYSGYMGMNYGYPYTQGYAHGAVPEYSGATHGSPAYNPVPEAEPVTTGAVMPY